MSAPVPAAAAAPAGAGAAGSAVADASASAAGAAGAAGAEKKKKKKKKKKPAKKAAAAIGGDAAALADLASGFNGLTTHEFFRGTGTAKLAYSDKKGRHVVAARAIKAGEVVLESTPYGAVVSDAWVERVCHRCFRRPDTDPTAAAAGSSGGGGVLYCCAGCKHARFCSTACMNAFKAVHELECKTLSRLSELDIESDTTALRCVMRMLYAASMEQRYNEFKGNRESDKKIRVWKPKAGASFADVKGLISHENQFSDEHKDAFRDAFERVEKIMAPEAWISVDAALRLLLQIQVNAHHVVDAATKARVGLGLYPVASFLNHSCAPNVVYHFDPPNATLQCRAIADIPAGTEISYSYIDLYQPPKVRRQRLRDTYFVAHCDCSRCSKPISTSHDRYLSGFLCPKCGDAQRGLLKVWEVASGIPDDIDAALQQYDAANPTAAAAAAATAAADAKAAPAAAGKGLNSAVTCANCGDASVKLVDCVRAMQYVQREFAAAHANVEDAKALRDTLEAKLMPYAMRSPKPTANTAAAAGAGAAAANDAKTSGRAALLHPFNSLMFAVTSALINACRATDDFRGQRHYTLQLIAAHNSCFDVPHPETADAYLSLGEALMGIAAANDKAKASANGTAGTGTGSGGSSERDLEEREAVLKAAVDAFQKCADLRTVCLGEGHEQTRLARELVARFGGKKAAAAAQKKKK